MDLLWVWCIHRPKDKTILKIDQLPDLKYLLKISRQGFMQIINQQNQLVWNKKWDGEACGVEL